MREISYRLWDKSIKLMSPVCLIEKDHFGEIIRIETFLDHVVKRIPKIEDVILLQYSGLLDKNRECIFEGDLVLSYKKRVKSDYIPKKYPQDKLNVICEVIFLEGKFTTKYIRNADEHIGINESEYRYWSYLPNVQKKGFKYFNPKTGELDIEGDDKTCSNLEIIGNIYDNPELLERKEP